MIVGATDPGATDPGATDPGATDPGATDPGATEPGAKYVCVLVLAVRAGEVENTLICPILSNSWTR